MEDAVKLAKENHTAVLIVGLSSEWEAEGSDRPTMDLPARQHELIEKVWNVFGLPRTEVSLTYSP